jgi:hypothetical protein
MPLTIPLTPDLEAQLIAEAARTGVAPERLAAGLLARHLRSDRREAAVALLDSWLAEAEADPTEQRETGEALVRELDAGRPGQRPHFPPELEGLTW